VPVDFFATTPENWWVSLVVRTGSLEMNLELTKGANHLGRSLNVYGRGVTRADGTVIPATSEEHVFELCGVKYRVPSAR
jgi:DNA polymerase/3'-5' exonuclease PolX